MFVVFTFLGWLEGGPKVKVVLFRFLKKWRCCCQRLGLLVNISSSENKY